MDSLTSNSPHLPNPFPHLLMAPSLNELPFPYLLVAPFPSLPFSSPQDSLTSGLPHLPNPLNGLPHLLIIMDFLTLNGLPHFLPLNHFNGLSTFLAPPHLLMDSLTLPHLLMDSLTAATCNLASWNFCWEQTR